MMDDHELAMIAAFRLHEVASRLNVLSRVAHSAQLKEALQVLSEQLASSERTMTDIGQTVVHNARP